MKLKKFYADWCGPCKMQSMIIAGLGDKITTEIININIDEDIYACTQLNIRSVPTMILVDDEDREIKRHTGVMKEPELLKWLSLS